MELKTFEHNTKLIFTLYYDKKIYVVNNQAKCGLISVSFSLWLKSPKMGAKLQPWAFFLYVDIAQGCDLAHIYGYLSENLSEIKPHLKWSA